MHSNNLALLGDLGEEQSHLSYWQRIKNKIKELLALPFNIAKLKRANLALQAKIKDPVQKAKLVASASKLTSMLPEAEKVKAHTEKYLPTWEKKDKEAGLQGFAGYWSGNFGSNKDSYGSSNMSGLGVIPFLIVGAAAVSLTYVGVKGLSLLKSYQQEKAIFEQVAAKTLSIEDAEKLIKSVKPSGGALESLFGSLGSNLGLALGAGILIIGGYYAYQSGMFKKK